ncbi:hypothetical protein ACFLWI_05660 [Chloroflexota bacterium]
MRVLFIDPGGLMGGLNTGLAYLCVILRPKHEGKVRELAMPGPLAKRPIEAILVTIRSFSPQSVCRGVSDAL